MREETWRFKRQPENRQRVEGQGDLVRCGCSSCGALEQAFDWAAGIGVSALRQQRPRNHGSVFGAVGRIGQIGSGFGEFSIVRSLK